MEALARRALALLIVYLVASLEFWNVISLERASAQTRESYEDFLRKLERYFGEAAPPESAPIEECEYVVPDGFDPSAAERIWKDLSLLVSLGRAPEDFAGYLSAKNLTLLALKLEGSTMLLNFSGLSLERSPDGSVRVKVPVVSNASLRYLSYNSTNVVKLYRVWNETSLRYYKVSRVSGYKLTYLDLESGERFSVKSDLTISEFPRGGLSDLLPAERLEVEELNWGKIAIASSTPVIAVPGHYEEIRKVVPEQRASFKVLFPAYDPAMYEGWLVSTSISSTSLTAGQSFTVSYSAYPEGVDPEQVPLQASISVISPSAIQVVGSGSAQLDNVHRNGGFNLKALKAGTYEITLRLQGNALFYSMPPSEEIRYTVQVTTPASPSVGVSIAEVDTSVPKYAKLKVRLGNNGGSVARSVSIIVSGDVAEASFGIGDIEPGQVVEREFNVKLKEQEADVLVSARYFDVSGNRFTSSASTQIFSLHFVVPEHYEEYVVTIPEHEETEVVFVPGYEGYTHVRFYAAYSFVVGNPNIYAPPASLFFPGIVLDVPTLYYEAFGTKIPRGETLSTLRTYLIPLPYPGLELSVSKEGNFSQQEGISPNFMLVEVEPCWEELGLLEEGEVMKAWGLTKEKVRGGEVPETFRAELANEIWVPSKKAVMNSTEFVKFRAAMESYIAEKGLAGELRYGWEEFVNATRACEEIGEKGFAVFVYHPLTVRGNGALKSIQVKNYAACDLSYELRIVKRSIPSSGFGVPALEEVQNVTSLKVQGMGDLSLFASSLAKEGYQLRAQLVYGCRVVAEVVFDLQPEASPFWSGFWDGVKEKLPGIVVTTAILVVLAVPTGGCSLLAEVKAFVTSSLIPTLMGASVAANIMELVDAYSTYERMGEVAEALDGFSSRAMNNGHFETSSLFGGLGDRIRGDQKLVIESTALDLLADLTVRDLFVAFGRENSTEYEKGVATGRVFGSALSFIAYSYTYYKLFTEGPKLLSWRGKIKAFLKGVYNWVTPPLYDYGVIMGRFAAEEVAASLALSERSSAFREQLNVVKDDEAYLSSLVEFTGRYLDKALDISETLGLSEKAFVGLLWAYGNKAKDLGEENWVGFLEDIYDIGGGSRGCVDEYLRWMYNAEVDKLNEIMLGITPRLADLSAEELEGIGKALATKGLGDSFEKGFKFFDTYFKTVELEQYGRNVANALTGVVSNNPAMLDVWSEAIDDRYPIYFARSPSTYLVPTPEDQSKIQGKVVDVYVLDPNMKGITAEAPRKVKQPTLDDPEPEKVFKFPGSDIKSGDENLILIKKFMVEDFYNKYEVKNRITIKNGEAYYVNFKGEIVEKLGHGVLDGYKDEVWIDFLFRDLKGKAKPEDAPELKIRVSDSGYQMLIDASGERNAIREVELRSVWDESKNVIAELLFARTPEGPLRGIYLLSRDLPEGWKWCLSNEENVINLERGQVKISVEDLFWRILDPQTYEKLEVGLDSGMVRVATVFDTPSGKVTRWKGTSDMNFMVPEGATAISKLYIVWADMFEHKLGDTSFKTFVETHSGIPVKGIEIVGSEGSITLQADYQLSLPTTGKTTLMVDLPFSGNFKPAFDIYVDDSGNLVAKPTLKYVLQGEIQNSWDVVKCEYQQTYYTTKGVKLDQILVLYKEDGTKRIIGLMNQVPANIDTEHVVAVMHAEDILKEMGCEKMKYEDYRETPRGDRRYDITTMFQGKEMLSEVKTGIEIRYDEEQIFKDISYLKSKEESSMIYYFDNPPSGHGAKKYLQRIRQAYLENPSLKGRVFIIVGREGNIVEPTHSSLDPYMPKE